MDKKYNDAFCVIPFIHLNTTTGGLYRYCCIMEDAAKDAAGEPFTLNGSRIDEVWNSGEVTQMRRDMIAGKQVPQCKKCYTEEKFGSRSLRKDYTESWLERKAGLVEQRIKSASENDGRLEEMPVFVELKFNNLCNIKCRMCSPFDSSLVRKEYEEIASENAEFDKLWGQRKYVLYNEKMKIDDLPVWHENPAAFNQYLELIPHLEKMHFAGGEPTLHRQFYEIIDKIIELKCENRVELSFNTNMTYITQEFIDKLEKFKSVKIHASIDGYQKTQEYIRFPTKWQSVSENLEKLYSTKENIEVYVSPTVQIYNLFELPELFRFVDTLNSKGKKHISVTPGVLDGPDYFNFRILPLEVRQEAAALWKSYAESETRSEWFRERLLGLAALIGYEEHKPDEKLLRQFVLVTGLLDKKRKQNFQENYPMLSEKINSYLTEATR